MTTSATPAWYAQARCRGMPAAWFYGDEGSHATNNYVRGKRVCAVCPVCQECADYAISTFQHLGLWGGLTPRARQKLRVGRRREMPDHTLVERVARAVAERRG